MTQKRNNPVPVHQQPDSPHNPSNPNRLLRLSGVLDIIPVSRSSWWSWVASGKAPAPIHLGRCTCWRYSDVMAFVGMGVQP